MSYAIVKTGGKQYRVEEGQTLLVEKVEGDAGAAVELEPLMAGGKNVVFGADASKIKVAAEIVEQVKGPKLRVNKFKPKRGYRRRAGHRQQLTRIRVTKISA
ncbi:MAG: 50S ribosomal protein L21 [Baekduia sp.]